MSEALEKSAGLPLGEPVDWSPVAAPAGEVLRGERVLPRPFDPAADAEALHATTRDDPTIWAYLRIGPFEDSGALRAVSSTTRASPRGGPSSPRRGRGWSSSRSTSPSRGLE